MFNTVPDTQGNPIFGSYSTRSANFNENMDEFVKAPNDLYIDDHKIGGIMCNIVNNFVVCGIGLNIESSIFSCIESGIIDDIDMFLQSYFSSICSYTWQDVFNKYQLEFSKNDTFSFHYGNVLIPFKDAKLLYDGSIEINGEVIYSFR